MPMNAKETPVELYKEAGNPPGLAEGVGAFRARACLPAGRRFLAPPRLARGAAPALRCARCRRDQR